MRIRVGRMFPPCKHGHCLPPTEPCPPSLPSSVPSSLPLPLSLCPYLLPSLSLGLASLNPDYIPGLLASLQIPHSLGFVGGRPHHAIYFVGAEGGREGGREGGAVVGLDPHTVQVAPGPQGDGDLGGQGGREGGKEGGGEGRKEGGREGGRRRYRPTDEHLRSVQCRTPAMMLAKDLDPSLALGFYLRNEVDFQLFIQHVHALKDTLQRHRLPVPFSVEQAPPEYEGAMMQSLVEEEEHRVEEEEEEEEEDLEDDYVVI